MKTGRPVRSKQTSDIGRPWRQADQTDQVIDQSDRQTREIWTRAKGRLQR